jgi:hypothetical protein
MLGRNFNRRQDGHPRSKASPVNIVELEHRFDNELQKPRTSAGWQALLDAGTRWSEAVWSEADSKGAIELHPPEQDLGLHLARQAIFVCGVHRSGTTLLRDLLDGHPAISMLPAEGSFFTNHASQLRGLPRDRQRRFLTCEWLRRLANPINQPPYWLLGRTSKHDSAYVRFARSLIAWWDVLDSRSEQFGSSWPLIAIALAYARSTGTLSDTSTLRWWGEKTPTNERFLSKLRAEFPQAKVILIVRHPIAVLASRRQVEQRSGGTFRNRAQVLKELRSSYEIAATELQRGDNEHFMLIKYEQLIEDTQATVDTTARYLGIQALPILMKPTVAGMPATTNSSFAHEQILGRIHADSARNAPNVPTDRDIDRLAAVVGDAAASIGYQIPASASWRARLRRVGSRLNPVRT